MISRRLKIHVKPNVNKRPAFNVGTPTQKQETPTLNASDVAKDGECLSSRPLNTRQEAIFNEQQQCEQSMDASSSIAADEEKDETVTANVNLLKRSEKLVSPYPVLASALKAPSGSISPIKQSATPRSVDFVDSTLSSSHSNIPLSIPSRPASVSSVSTKWRRNFTGDEKLDPKTMTMADLISWNPKSEQGLLTPGHEGKKNNRGRKRKKASDTSNDNDPSKFSPIKINAEEKMSPKMAVPTPQVKLSTDGGLILDEESLTVRQEPSLESKNWETVEEGRVPRKISSMSFRRRPFRSCNVWSEQETDLFFRIISATGTDFSLMHDFFPNRTRIQLKNKFSREKRVNADRLNTSLALPSTLDESLYEIAKTINDEIYEKKQSIRTGREKKKMFKKNQLDEDDSEEEDFEEEAKKEINRLQTMFQKPSLYGRRRRLRTTEDTVDIVTKRSKLVDQVLNSTRQIANERVQKEESSSRSTSLALPLGSDFPPFEMVPTSAKVVSIMVNPIVDRPPIVYLPRNCQMKVVPPMDKSTARLLFRCPSTGPDDSSREYVLQHERSSDPNSSDFLHLFVSILPSD